MLSLLAFALAAQADPEPDCKDPQTQTDMNMCSGQAFRAADVAMNRAWEAAAKVMKSLDQNRDQSTDKRPGYFATLLESQRAWLKVRDTQCTAEGYYARGGTMEPLLFNTCAEGLTEQRTKQLRELAEQYNQ